jgi:hypothetical protein
LPTIPTADSASSQSSSSSKSTTTISSQNADSQTASTSQDVSDFCSSFLICLGISDTRRDDEPRCEPCIDRSGWQNVKSSVFVALLLIPPLMFVSNEPRSLASLLIIFVDVVILTLLAVRRLSTRIFLYLLRNFEFSFLLVRFHRHVYLIII